MATREQLKIASEKAKLSPKQGKRGKGKKTLDKEERRKIFEEIISEEFEDIIKAARPEYKLDQFIGKAPDRVEVKDITERGELTEEERMIKQDIDAAIKRAIDEKIRREGEGEKT